MMTTFVDALDLTPDDAGCGTFGNPCNTIQSGVDAAPVGGEVYVAGGLYSENITITKSLTVRGERGSVSIIPPALLDGMNINGTPTAPISVTVEDISVSSGVIGIQAGEIATLELVNVSSTLNSKDGVSVDDAESVVIRESRFIDNGINGITLADISGTAVVQDSSAMDNTDNGLDAADSTFVVVEGGSYTGNFDSGIAIRTVDLIDIDQFGGTGATVSENGGHGLTVSGSGDTEIDDATFSGNGLLGATFSLVGDVEVTNSTFTENETGLRIHGGDAFIDTQGFYADNLLHGVWLTDLADSATLISTVAVDNDANLDGEGDGVHVNPEDALFGIGDNLTIEGGTFSDTDGVGPAKGQENGVFVDSVAGEVSFRDWDQEMESVLATGNAKDALSVMDAGSVTVHGGTYNSNGIGGIRVDLVPGRTEIQDVTTSFNVMVGTEVRRSSTVDVRDGVFDANGMFGLALGGFDAATVSGSSSDLNTVNGLIAFDAGALAVSDSHFHDNVEAGIRTTSVDRVELTDGVTAIGNLTGVHTTFTSSFSDSDGVYSKNDDHGLLLEGTTGAVTLTRTTATDNDDDANGEGNGVLAIPMAGPHAIGGTLAIYGGTFSDTDLVAGPVSHQENGVLIEGVAGAVVVDNAQTPAATPKASGNAINGIVIIGGSTANMRSGEYSHNGRNGLELVGFAGAITIDSVEADSNELSGIHLVDNAGVTITDTMAESNLASGIDVVKADDVRFEGVSATKNTIGMIASELTSFADVDSVFSGNLDSGLALGDITETVHLRGTTANDNDANTDGIGNGITLDSFIGGVAVAGDVSLSGVTLNDTDKAGGAAAQHHGFWASSIGGKLSVSGVTSVVGNDSDGFAVLAATGDVSIVGGTYTSNGGDGIQISAASSGVSLSELTASSNGDDGIALTDVTGDTNLNKVTANENSGDGLHLIDVDKVVAVDVTSKGNDPGMLIESAASFADTRGNYSRNDDHGLVLVDVTDDVTLTRTTANNNDADNNNVGNGVHLVSTGSTAVGGDLRVIDAIFSDTDGDGAAEHQETGLFVESIRGLVSISDTSATGNDVDGVDIADGGRAVSLAGGTYSDNGDEGIRIRSVTGETSLSSLTASGNGTEGVEIDMVSTVVVNDLTASLNGLDGLSISVAAGVSISGGTYADNVEDGVDLFMTGRADIREASITGNGGALVPLGVGIRASDAPALSLSGLTLTGNEKSGVDSSEIPILEVTTSTESSADSVSASSTALGLTVGPVVQDAIEYSDVTSLSLSTGLGEDTLSLSLLGLPVAVTVDGGEQDVDDALTIIATAGSDTLAVTETTVTNGSTTVTYSAIESLTIDAGAGEDAISVDGSHTTILGGPGNDSFSVTSTGDSELVLDGQDGDDLYDIDLGDIAGSRLGNEVTISDSGSVGSTGDSATIRAGDADDTLWVSPYRTMRDETDIVNYDGRLESVEVLGGLGNDDFTVVPSDDTIITVDGEDPTPPPTPAAGDRLEVKTLGLSSTDDGLAVTVAGKKPVRYKSIESVDTGSVDTTSPAVLSVEVNAGMSDPDDLPSGPQSTSWMTQRSSIRTITIEFTEPVTMDASDITLVNLGVNAPVDADTAVVISDSHITEDGATVTLTFEAGELTDGAYELTLDGSIVDAAGNLLDGNGDTLGGDDYVLTGSEGNRFYRLEADWTGDSVVTIRDFLVFAYWYGTPAADAPEYVNLNGDSAISIRDFLRFAENYTVSIDYPAPTPVPKSLPAAKGVSSHSSESQVDKNDKALMEVLAEWSR